MCGNGFEMIISSEPEKDREGYWVVRGFPTTKDSIATIRAHLAHYNEHISFFKGDKVRVIGRLVNRSFSTIYMREAEITKIRGTENK